MLHRVKKKNDIHNGRWNGLGGKIEAGETPEECVIREVKEESGLRIRNPKLRGILTFPMFDDKSDWLCFLFTANKFQGRMIDSNEGNLEWIQNEDLTSLHLWEGDKLFLKWLEKKEFFSAKFVYKKNKLKDHNVTFYS